MRPEYKITIGVGLAIGASLALVCYAIYALGRLVEDMNNEESDARTEEAAQRGGQAPVHGGPRASA